MNFRRVFCLLTMSLFLLCGLSWWRTPIRPTLPQSLPHPVSVAEPTSSLASTPPVAPQIKKPLPVDQRATNLLREAISGWARSIPEPKFARFAEWAERYVRSAGPDKLALEMEGEEL